MRRIARRIAAFATSRTPAAASRSPSPSACATGSSAARARAASTRIASPRSASPAERARHRVGVGDRGRRAPEAVARGTRPGARALRPHAERRALGPGQRPPARADRLDADRGQPHRVPAQPPLGQGLGPPVGDQADVGGRPAHVEGDGVPEPDRPREEPRRRDAARRPRHGHGERSPPRDRRRHHAAARLEQVERRADARPGERGLEVGEVPVRDRHDRRVQRRRRRALVLPELRVDLVGHGDERDLPLERRPEAGLVGRVRIGVEEADGHRLDAARAERRRQGRQLVLREGHGDPAVGEDALRHLEPEVAGHERRRPRRDDPAGRAPGGSGGRSRARPGSPAWSRGPCGRGGPRRWRS